jgi:hypothetical protein
VEIENRRVVLERLKAVGYSRRYDERAILFGSQLDSEPSVKR